MTRCLFRQGLPGAFVAALAVSGCAGGSDEEALSCPPQGCGGPSWSGPEEPPVVEALAAGANGGHACALMSDRTLRCWGDNYWGQAGVPDPYPCATQPTPVRTIMDVYEVAPGTEQTCARLRDGTVACWGTSKYGALGSMEAPGGIIPLTVPDVGGVTRLTAVGFGSLALRGDGTVWTWGPWHGAHAPSSPSWSPMAIEGLDSVRTPAESTDCAVKDDGTVWCWGWNEVGQLGDGTTQHRWAPGPVKGLADAVQAAGNGATTCALRSSGEVCCWGDNHFGALGNSSVKEKMSLVPVAVAGLRDVKQVRLGGWGWACAVLADGTIECWGAHGADWAGDGSGVSAEPVVIQGLAPVRSIALGFDFSCALLEDRSVWCWGANECGQLGNGTTDASWDQPTKVRF
ncbi:MAG: hypothetical protein HY744_34550 [Deltaproteobacteria bacterium]|nr:hypothetical protein [Deltaproteobacteria bacterium]